MDANGEKVLPISQLGPPLPFQQQHPQQHQPSNYDLGTQLQRQNEPSTLRQFGPPQSNPPQGNQYSPQQNSYQPSATATQPRTASPQNYFWPSNHQCSPQRSQMQPFNPQQHQQNVYQPAPRAQQGNYQSMPQQLNQQNNYLTPVAPTQFHHTPLRNFQQQNNLQPPPQMTQVHPFNQQRQQQQQPQQPGYLNNFQQDVRSVQSSPFGQKSFSRSRGVDLTPDAQPAAKMARIDSAPLDGSWNDSMFENIEQIDFNKVSKLPWNPDMWKKWYDEFSNRKDTLRLSNVIELLFRYTEQFICLPHFVMQMENQGSAKISAPARQYDIPCVYFRYPKSPELPEEPIIPGYLNTSLYVVNADVLDIATNLPGDDVAILNVCNPRCLWKKDPGKNVLNQENAILTQTSLALALASIEYPMPNYACVYVSNVAVNRSGIENGFAYNSAQKRLDIVNMADDVITSKEDPYESSLQQLRVKFETVLRTFLHHKKTVIVVPPFGCGSLKSIGDSAAVLKAVLLEFACCFKKVYFAISENYYSEEVLHTYAKELVSKKGDEIKKGFKESVPDVLCRQNRADVFYMRSKKELCPLAGKCTDSKLSHANKYLHPKMCQDPKCPRKDDPIHATMYIHGIQCKYVDTCNYYLEYCIAKNQNKEPSERFCYHAFRFTHKPPCPIWDTCKDSSPEHIEAYFHKPNCSYGLECLKQSDASHEARFSHNIPPCPYGAECLYYADKDHTQQFSHPFLPFCPMAPYYCTEKSSLHFRSFSHICPNGPDCSMRKDPEHSHRFIHVGINCPKGAACDDFSEKHLGTYFHPDTVCMPLPVRKLCSDSRCTENDPVCAPKGSNLRRNFRHYWNGSMISMSMLNVLDPDMPAEPMWSSINSNGISWNEKLDKYLKGSLDTSTQNFVDIVRWFRSMRPNHMCSSDVFLSILTIGCYASLELLRNFWVKPKDLLETVLNCPYMEMLMEKYAGIFDSELLKNIKTYTKRVICCKQNEIKDKYAIGALANRPKFLELTPVISQKKIAENKELRVSLGNAFEGMEKFLDELDNLVYRILNSIIALSRNPPGVKNASNKVTKTNHTVFTVVGPHYGEYGGGEVVMVLKKDVMNHPDFYMCPVNALSYSNNNGYTKNRPWITQTPLNPKGYSNDFLCEKFSRCSFGWEIAAAKEWIARTSLKLKKRIDAVTLSDVMTFWRKEGVSNAMEGHLPSRVPFDYTESIIITQAAYKKVCGTVDGKYLIKYLKKKYSKKFFIKTKGKTQPETEKYLMSHPISQAECSTGMTFHVENENEKILPIALAGDNFFMTFSAKGKFYATLATSPRYDDAGRNVVTISPINKCTGLAAWYSAPMGCLESNKIAECDFFNTACPYKDFIQYCIAVDQTAKTITVTHWGPSSALSCTKLVVDMGKGPNHFSYLSFAGKSDEGIKHVAVYDLVVTGKEPERALEPENFPLPPKGKSLDLPRCFDTRPPPMCQKPFECPIMYNTNDPEYPTHTRSFRHVCKYGKDKCKEFKDPEHRRIFMHLDKQPCPCGPGCTKLTDPAHRLEFSHDGFLDYLFPCKHGERCWDKDKTTTKHCMEYHHNPKFKYPNDFKYV